MLTSCPQYKYSLEEQKERFPFFPIEAYHNIETMRQYICKACKEDCKTTICPRLT